MPKTSGDETTAQTQGNLGIGNGRSEAESGDLTPKTKPLREGFEPASFQVIMNTEWYVPMILQNANSHLPVCWLHQLVCPRRHLAVLPSQVRPSLFGSD
jgi:hypothetical protein